MKSQKGELASELMEIALTKLKIADVLANKRHDQLNQYDIEPNSTLHNRSYLHTCNYVP